jgi:ribonuclease BN (tRNA processing enzyme)
MKLTFLGTGSAIPSERVHSGLVVEDEGFLFDCGSGVLHNLNRSRVPVDGVTNVFLTHRHLDHVNDFMALVKADWLLGRENLRVHGPNGIAQVIDDLFEAYDYLRGRVSVRVNEFEPGDEFEVGDHEIRTFPTEHSVPSTAYRFDDSFVYTGDTEAIEGIAEFASGCDVLIHECSFPDEVEVSNHTRPSELAPVLEDCFANRLYLTHLYPHTRGKEEEMVEKVSEGFGGEVQVAEDMQTVEVKD